MAPVLITTRKQIGQLDAECHRLLNLFSIHCSQQDQQKCELTHIHTDSLNQFWIPRTGIYEIYALLKILTIDK